jgi:hypothetical protein
VDSVDQVTPSVPTASLGLSFLSFAKSVTPVLLYSLQHFLLLSHFSFPCPHGFMLKKNRIYCHFSRVLGGPKICHVFNLLLLLY